MTMTPTEEGDGGPASERTDAGEGVPTRQVLRSLRLGAITNRIISASASLVALAALATAVYQTKLARDQAKAAVWPYLLVGNAGDQGYSRIVQNVGLGPAVIGAVEVRVNGHAVHTWHEAADSMHVKLSGRGYASTSFHGGMVVPVGGRIDLVNLRDTSDIRAFRAALGANTVETRICYCSLYGDCWDAAQAMMRPKAVKVCTQDPKAEFIE
jgi:hypothetical protein